MSVLVTGSQDVNAQKSFYACCFVYGVVGTWILGTVLVVDPFAKFKPYFFLFNVRSSYFL